MIKEIQAHKTNYIEITIQGRLKHLKMRSLLFRVITQSEKMIINAISTVQKQKLDKIPNPRKSSNATIIRSGIYSIEMLFRQLDKRTKHKRDWVRVKEQVRDRAGD